MAITSEATTVWRGELMSGSGEVNLDSSNAAHFDVDWRARAEGEAGVTNPEELIGAAHSACFAMAFSNILTGHGKPPENITLHGAHDFHSGGEIGSVSAASSAFSAQIGKQFKRVADTLTIG